MREVSRQREVYRRRGHARHICKDCSSRTGRPDHASAEADVDQESDPDTWAMETETTESRLIRDLTLMLMYLTSCDDGSDGTSRCPKTFRSETVEELIALGPASARTVRA